MTTFEGFFNGKWGEPVTEPGGSLSYTGTGTHTFSWGQPSGGDYPNGLSLIINPFAAEVDSLFQVAELLYFNGSTSNSDVDFVPLNLELELFIPTRVTEVFAFDFDVLTTPNNGTPEENADSVFPLNKTANNVFTYDGSDYLVKLVGFSQDGGETIEEEFNVLENEATIAGLFAQIEENPTSGGSEDDKITGTADNDYLDGKGGNDTLLGRAGEDVLIGGNGNDVLKGGTDDDLLMGGKGKDNLRGQAGNDTFVLTPGGGRDRIIDFTDGSDKIGLTEDFNFEELTIAQANSNTSIKNGNDLLAILKGIDSTLITEEDFVSVVI